MEKEKRSAFANRLRSLRKSQKLTQEAVATHLQLHRTAYTKYETDKAAPDRECLMKMADLFHVSVDYLLGKSEDTASGIPMLKDAGASLSHTPEETALLTFFHALTPEERKKVLEQLEEKAKDTKK